MDEVKLIRSFLEDERRVVYGFVMLQDYYRNINKWMNNDNIKCYRSFCILNELGEALTKAFQCVNVNLLCDEFEWASFIKDVLQVAYRSAQGKFANAQRAEIQSLLLIGRMLGKAVSSDKCDVKRQWVKKLFDFNYKVDFVDEKKVVVADCIFIFLASLLLFEKSDLIKKVFYDDLKKIAGEASESFLLSFLFFSCYLYYLAFKENENVVNDISADIREKCVCLLVSTRDVFKFVLKQFVMREINFCKFPYKRTNVFNETFFETFHVSLRRYEHYLDNEAKILVMDECVDEFISFCLIYMRSQTLLGNIPLESFVDENKLESLYLHFKSNEGIKDSFRFFTEYFVGCDGLDEFLNSFVARLSDCHKKKLLREGASFPEDDIKLIEQEIVCNLRDSFKECLVDDCENIRKIELLSCASIPQHMVIRNVISSHDDIFILNLLIHLFNELRESKKMEILDVSKNDDDEQILSCVEKHKGCVYIGCEALLQPYDIVGCYKRYTDAVQNLKRIHKCGWQIGMFINIDDFEICIKNVKVIRRPKTIGDVNTTEENGFYKYSPSQGEELSFKKNELEKYLSTHESILSISAEIGYKLKTDKKMDVLFRGKSRAGAERMFY